MASDLVNAATTDKLTEIDWDKNIQICELVVRDHRQAKDVIKAIKKRLGSKNQNTQLFAVSLLEMLMNNIGDPVHKQVIDNGIIPILVKIVKKKSNQPVQEKIFLLLDAAQTSLGGASGRFPQYYSAYYDLVNSGIQFPQPVSNIVQESSPDKELSPSIEPESVKVPESSILEKAVTTLEILRDVLDAIDSQHPETAKDEFTLDLVEQCSYQKQIVTQLAMTSRDDMMISQAIELNEHLEKVLARHEALISSRPILASNVLNHENEDEEEPEQLFRRQRKGKARVGPEDEDQIINRPLRLQGSNVRPLRVEPKEEPNVTRSVNIEAKQEQDVNSKRVPLELKQEENVKNSIVALPPPPAKYAERERFFKENKSVRTRKGSSSSSRSGSVDFGDEIFS